MVELYMSGKTIVENRVERLAYSQLPAITICLPTFLDMELFAELKLRNSNNPDHFQLYNEFLELKNMSQIGWSQMAQDKQRDIFEKMLWKVYIGSQITLKEVFDDILVDIKVKNKSTSHAFNERGDVVVLPIPTKVHSIAPLLDPRLCVTIFSVFDEYYRDAQLSLIDLEISFEHKLLAFPFIRYHEGDLYISLHSSNILPEFKRENIFQKLSMSKVNFITYSETQTKLLPPPYETKCKEYDRTQNTRSDCIQKCVDQKLSQEFDLNCTWTFNNLILIRKKNSFESSYKSLCNHHKEHRIWRIVDEQNRFRKQCEDFCPKNCFETFYSYEIETRKGEFFIEPHNVFSINLEHNRFPDQVIEHKPIYDWLTLVSNLGGLLGMWLGLSFAFIFDKIIDKIFETYFHHDNSLDQRRKTKIKPIFDRKMAVSYLIQSNLHQYNN